jgi:hypothetical protein
MGDGSVLPVPGRGPRPPKHEARSIASCRSAHHGTEAGSHKGFIHNIPFARRHALDPTIAHASRN